MARFTEPTLAQERKWRTWVAARPEAVRKIAERFEPWSLYRMKDGSRVTIVSFAEDGTVTVSLRGKYNAILFERSVFGVNPDELIPCDLPGPEEPVGAAMTDSDVVENIDDLRVMIRPDLWELGPDGKARRRDN